MAASKLDALGAAAVDLAAAALAEVTLPGQFGEHVTALPGPDRIVTHIFECTMPGYRGWHWEVTVVRAPRSKTVTVSETALLPGEGALLAPEWEPWAQRLRPSDVGADDVLPFIEDDERLDQAYENADAMPGDDDAADAWEIGLGRKRILNREGRAQAAQRWSEGEFGPRPLSRRGRRGTVMGHCSTCGFMVHLAGSLRGAFGVCANEWSPADGRVVALDYGCGAHSETKIPERRKDNQEDHVVVDELQVDYVDLEEETAADDSIIDKKRTVKVAKKRDEQA